MDRTHAMGPLGQAANFLDLLECVARAAIDAQGVAARVLHDVNLAVRGYGVRTGQRIVERLPASDVAIELAAPKHAVVPAVDKEIGVADLVEKGGRKKAGLPASAAGGEVTGGSARRPKQRSGKTRRKSWRGLQGVNVDL